MSGKCGVMLTVNYGVYCNVTNCKLFVCAVNVGEDCPVFDGLYEYCQLSAGGSVGTFMLLWLCISC